MKSYAKNVQSIKNDNRATILNLIRKTPISRAEISSLAGLSKSSVTMITNALIAEGQVREIGTEGSSVGRKRILLDIVADYRFAAGIILHRRDIKVCITNLKCEVLDREITSIERFKTAGEVIDYTVNTVFELINRNGLNREDCIGIGVSCPGPLDMTRGVVLSPPHLDILHNVPVADEIRAKTGMNISLENNAVLLAMRENIQRDKMQNFMSVIISYGIGSAVVTGGEIYRGALGFSGELGHISVVADGLPCPCGNNGCLERYVSLAALKERFGFADYKHEIVDAAYEGEKQALEVLRFITSYLGSGLVSAINLFDLDAVILHGDYSYRPELLNRMLKEYIDKNSVVAAVHGVEVISSPERNDRDEGNSTAAIIEQYFDQTLEG